MGNSTCARSFAVLLGLLFLLPSTAGAIVQPISYWNFNDGTVTDQADGNDATSIVGATFASDTPTNGGANSLDLTNGNDYVALPSVTYGITNSYTISAWVKTSSVSGRFFSIKRDLTSGGGDRTGVNLGLSGSSVYTGLIASDGVDDTTNTGNTYHDMTANGVSVSTGTWTHVAATLENDVVTMYVNGVAATSYSGDNGSGTGRLKTTGQNIDFVDADGSFSGFGADGRGGAVPGDITSWYNGLLDEVAVWNSGLTANAVKQLAAGASPTALPEPLDLSGKFNRDTIARDSSEPTGGGYRSQGEVFPTVAFQGTPNIPDNGEVVVGGQMFQLGGFDANNTWLLPVNATDTLDITDTPIASVSVLFSAVGYNPTSPDDGTLTATYADGSNEVLPWDVRDSNGAGGSGLGLAALSGLDLYQAGTGVISTDDRYLFYQTFLLDGTKVLDSLTFSTVGVDDAGGDAQFGIYAINGIAGVPEPSTAMLLATGTLLLLVGRRLRRRRSVS